MTTENSPTSTTATIPSAAWELVRNAANACEGASKLNTPRPLECVRIMRDENGVTIEATDGYCAVQYAAPIDARHPAGGTGSFTALIPAKLAKAIRPKGKPVVLSSIHSAETGDYTVCATIGGASQSAPVPHVATYPNVDNCFAPPPVGTPPDPTQPITTVFGMDLTIAAKLQKALGGTATKPRACKFELRGEGCGIILTPIYDNWYGKGVSVRALIMPIRCS